MNKKSFYERASKITKEAESFIESLFAGRKRVIKFCDKDADEIYDMPQFAAYGKYGFVGWCNVFEIRKIKHTVTDWETKKPKTTKQIQVSGMDNENGIVEQVFLHEIDDMNIIYIATYLQAKQKS